MTSFVIQPGDLTVLPRGKMTVEYTVDNSKSGRYYDGHFLVGGEADEQYRHKLLVLDNEDIESLLRQLNRMEPKPKNGFLFTIEQMLGSEEGGVSLPEPISLDLL